MAVYQEMHLSVSEHQLPPHDRLTPPDIVLSVRQCVSFLQQVQVILVSTVLWHVFWQLLSFLPLAVSESLLDQVVLSTENK